MNAVGQGAGKEATKPVVSGGEVTAVEDELGAVGHLSSWRGEVEHRFGHVERLGEVAGGDPGQHRRRLGFVAPDFGTHLGEYHSRADRVGPYRARPVPARTRRLP